MPRRALKLLTGPNRNWGICGFCGTLGALYMNNEAMRLRIRRMLDQNHLKTRILAEIKTFLQLLRAQGKQDLIDEIVQINLKHHGEDFDYLAYINKISGIVNAPPTNDDNFTLALMPDSLVYYLREMCEFPAARWLPGDPGGEGILGLSDKNSEKLVDRLAHWVYRDDRGKIYSWMEKFGSTEIFLDTLANAEDDPLNWRVDLVVKPTR